MGRRREEEEEHSALGDTSFGLWTMVFTLERRCSRT